VFTQKMFAQQVAGDRLHLRVELNGFQSHLSDDFQCKCILDRLFSPWSPDEWPVAVHEYSANLLRIEIAPRKFTAIVAANDHMALGALRALHAKGIRVPEHFSVVGYDDLPESRFFEPPLTTVHHDFAGQGERCVEVLLSMIKGEPFEPALQLLRPELIIRESTAVARR
jgi:DNA-binding LacI/PurR family transcriptional regulator